MTLRNVANAFFPPWTRAVALVAMGLVAGCSVPLDGSLPAEFSAPPNVLLEQSIENVFPDEGEALSKEEPYIYWESNQQLFIRLYYRYSLEEPWRLAPEGIPGRVRLPSISRDRTCRYFLAAPWEGRLLYSKVRRFRAVRGVEFLRNVMPFEVVQSVPTDLFLRVKNSGGEPRGYGIVFHGRGFRLPPGFLRIPAHTEPLAGGETRNVQVRVTPEALAPGRYEVFLEVITEGEVSSRDRALLYITVRKPRVDVDILVHDTAHTALERELVLVNKGDSLADLRVSRTGGAPVDFAPSMGRAYLAGGDDLRVSVRPRLALGWSGARTTLTVSSAGKTATVPLAFGLPGGRDVYFGRLDCVRRWRWAGRMSTVRPGRVVVPVRATGMDPRLVRPPDRGFGCRVVDGAGARRLGADGTGRPLAPATQLEFGETVQASGDGPLLLSFGTGAPVSVAPGTTVKVDRAFLASRRRELWGPVERRLATFLARAGNLAPRFWSGHKSDLLFLGDEAFGRLEYDASAYPSAVRAEGVLVASWHSSAEGEPAIYTARVGPGGFEGGAVVRVGPGQWPTLWSRGSRVLLLYERGRPLRSCVRLSRDGGRSWSRETVLARGPRRAEDVVLLAGRAVMTHFGSGREPRVSVLSYTSGRLWTFDPSSFRNCYGLAVAGTPAGETLVLRLERDGEDTYVRLQVLGSGRDPVRIRAEEGRAQDPCLLVDGEGQLHAVWRARRLGRLLTVYLNGRYRRDRLDLGDAITVPASGQDLSPSLQAADGTVRLLFARRRGAQQEMYWRTVGPFGRTFSSPRRLPVFPPSLSGAFLTFRLRGGGHPGQSRRSPWRVSLNGRTLRQGDFPEGETVLWLDPRLFRFGPGEENTLAWEPLAPPGGDDFTLSDVTVATFHRSLEEAVVETSQARAEAAVRSVRMGNGGSLPDVALVASRVEVARREDRGEGGPLLVRAEVFNLSPRAVEGVKLVVFADRLDGRVLAESEPLPPIEPFGTEQATAALSALDAKHAWVLWAGKRGSDFEPRNNVVHLPRTRFAPVTRGRLTVRSHREDDVSVHSLTMDREVLPFPANEAVPLPPGVYEVRSPTDRERVVLQPGSDRVVDLTNRGTVFVQAAGDFPLTVTALATGTRVAVRSCNTSFELRPGQYRIDVDPDGMKPFSFPYLRVRVGRETRLVQKEYGSLLVRAPGSFHMSVWDAFTGKLVRHHRCNSELVLREGVYRIVVNLREAGVFERSFVQVPFGKNVEVEVTNVGTFFLRAVENFYYRVLDAGTGRLVRSHWCNSPCLLRSGRYVVEVDPHGLEPVRLGPVIITGRLATEMKLRGFGHLVVKAIENFPLVVIDEATGARDAVYWCNSRILLPLGRKRVAVRVPGGKTRILSGIEVREAAVTRATVAGYGRVMVDALADFPLKVIDVDTDIVRVSGRCNRAFVLPVGTYRFVAEPRAGTPVTVARFEVFEGADLATRLKGFGYLEAMALQNFGLTVYRQGTQKAMYVGHCNERVVLPEGTYAAVVNPAGFPLRRLDNIRIRDGELNRLPVRGYGYLRVTAIENFPILVRPLDADAILLRGNCNDKFLLPAGRYRVCLNPRSLGLQTCGPFEVREGVISVYPVRGYGYIRVAAPVSFHFDVIDASTDRIVKTWRCNRKTVLPVGRYRFRCRSPEVAGLVVGPVTVSEAQETETPLTGIGKVVLEGLDGRAAVFRAEDGKKVCDVTAAVLHLKAGRYALSLAGRDPLGFAVTAGEETRLDLRGKR